MTDKNIEIISKEQNGRTRLLPITESNNVLNLDTYVTQYSLPSNRRINLTLPANGGTLTAPDNGWITLAKTANGNNQFIVLFNKTSGLILTNTVPSSGHVARGFIPVVKGDILEVTYNTGGQGSFYFTYLNGNKPKT